MDAVTLQMLCLQAGVWKVSGECISPHGKICLEQCHLPAGFHTNAATSASERFVEVSCAPAAGASAAAAGVQSCVLLKLQAVKKGSPTK